MSCYLCLEYDENPEEQRTSAHSRMTAMADISTPSSVPLSTPPSKWPRLHTPHSQICSFMCLIVCYSSYPCPDAVKACVSAPKKTAIQWSRLTTLKPESTFLSEIYSLDVPFQLFYMVYQHLALSCKCTTYLPLTFTSQIQPRHCYSPPFFCPYALPPLPHSHSPRQHRHNRKGETFPPHYICRLRRQHFFFFSRRI